MTNYEKESGDIDGPFALAVSIQNAGEGQIVWFTSSYFLDTIIRQQTTEIFQNTVLQRAGYYQQLAALCGIVCQYGSFYSYDYNTSFDGEGAITSAIDYVVSEEFPQLYNLEGHGEAALPTSFQERGRRACRICSANFQSQRLLRPIVQSNKW